VAVDGNGNAIVAWEHGSQIWFNRYNAATATWGTEGPVVVNGGQSISVGIDGQGVATLLWNGVSSGNSAEAIYTISSVAGGGWGPVTTLSTVPAFSSSLAVSANGTVVAVWVENDYARLLNNQFILWGSRRLPGGTWSSKTMIMYATDSGDRLPTAALDATGNGFVIWEQPVPNVDGGSDFNGHIWVSRFASGAFGTGMEIDNFPTPVWPAGGRPRPPRSSCGPAHTSTEAGERRRWSPRRRRACRFIRCPRWRSTSPATR
jgi:hypothetical protein